MADEPTLFGSRGSDHSPKFADCISLKSRQNLWIDWAIDERTIKRCRSFFRGYVWLATVDSERFKSAITSCSNLKASIFLSLRSLSYEALVPTAPLIPF